MVEDGISKLKERVDLYRQQICDCERRKKDALAEMSDLCSKRNELIERVQSSLARAWTLESERCVYIKRWNSLRTILMVLPYALLGLTVHTLFNQDSNFYEQLRLLEKYEDAAQAAQPDLYERCARSMVLALLALFVAVAVSALAVLLSRNMKAEKKVRYIPLVLISLGAALGAFGVAGIVGSELYAQADSSTMSALLLIMLGEIYLPIVLAPTFYEAVHGLLVAKGESKAKEGAEARAGAESMRGADVAEIDKAINECQEKCKALDLQMEDLNKKLKAAQEAVRQHGERAESLKTAEAELDGLVGLGEVKDAVSRWEKLARYGFMTGEQSQQNLNFTFCGNPGTGKTEVARIMGQLLYGLGLIPRADVIEVSTPDLVSPYVSETPKKTKEIIDRAEGAVLFVDEAYELVPEGDSGKSHGKEALETIMKAMEDRRGKMAFIFAGYTDEMQDLLDANPGIRSRIPENNRFVFSDYSSEELTEIAKRVLAKDGYVLDREVELRLSETLASRARSRDFGNARGARNAVEDLVNAYRVSVVDSEKSQDDRTIDSKVLTHSNLFSSEVGRGSRSEILKEADQQLESLIGLNSIKKAVTNWKDLIEFDKAMGNESGSSLNYLFLGNPGTGKTEVARIMGKLLYGLGLIPRADVIEVSTPDLVSPYVSETPKKTKEIIDRAEGAVLFVDEAYELVPEGDSGKSHGKEALETIMKAMEDRRGKMAFIFAGYTDEMQNFLDANPGMRSRIPESNHFTFSDYSAEELFRIAQVMMFKSYQLELDDDAAVAFRQVLATRSQSRDFGNARGVRNLVEELRAAQAAAWKVDKTIDGRKVSADTVSALIK